MGTFLNTTKQSVINSLQKGTADRLSEKFYYQFFDKKPTVVTYYNPNIQASTLDKGSIQSYSTKGIDAPIRFNKLNGTLIYGLERIQTDLNVTEYGVEADTIQGQAVVAPHTFKPYPDSFFTIDYLKEPYIFRITKVSMDTLDNGANFYIVDYVLDGTGYDFLNDIERRVVKTYNMISDNIGTDYKTFITSEDQELISKFQAKIDTLKEYFAAIFFRNSLQTFVYQYHEDWFYDPETIEFIIRNKLLSGTSEYIYVDQAIYLPRSFIIDYDKSIYKNVEDCNKDINIRRYYGILNCDPMSLLDKRLEEYYIVTPRQNYGLLGEPLEIYDPELLGAIINNEKYKDKKQFYNIISNYFNDQKTICECMLSWLDKIEYCNNAILYHILPIIIFILQKQLADFMKDQSDNTGEANIFD